MGELDPRIEKVRRIGVGVFVALAVASIPIGIHIVKTYESPELWLTLLGAVFMLLLICLYALETALLPIPKPNTQTTSSIDPDANSGSFTMSTFGGDAQTVLERADLSCWGISYRVREITQRGGKGPGELFS